MGKRRITLSQLRKILRSFDVEESPERGKGGHTYFHKRMEDGEYGYPVPTDR